MEDDDARRTVPARRSTAFVTGYLQGVALVLGVLVLLFLLSYVIF